jgi:hypothetical protein
MSPVASSDCDKWITWVSSFVKEGSGVVGFVAVLALPPLPLLPLRRAVVVVQAAREFNEHSQ